MVKVGVFDSGVGGLSVFHELVSKNKTTDFVYFADTARLPYGDKSRDQLRNISHENTKFLLDQGADLIVIACHSASAYAADWLRERFSVPIIDVITPSIKGALKATKNFRIAVLGTKATIRSSLHEKRLKELFPNTFVISQACPLLVPLIEECGVHHKAIPLFLHEYLTPLKEENIDTLILGCTHYPFLKEEIKTLVGNDVTLIDPGPLLKEELFFETTSKEQKVSYFVTEDRAKFSIVAKKIGHPLLGEVEELCKIHH
jgi:glutamate racemase